MAVIGENIKINFVNADWPSGWDWSGYIPFVMDGLTIHWGRENFYKPPSNRTLSMAITLPKKTTADSLLSWANSEIIISSKNPNIVIFQGFIDSVKGFYQDYHNVHDRYTLQFEATESPTWSTVFTNEIKYSGSYRNYGNRLNEINRQFGGLVFYDRNEAYLSIPKENTITVKQMAESLVWHPGAWPSWSPDWKRLASTLYTLDNPQKGPPWELPADKVIDLSPNFLFNEANSPTTILYTAGGIFGEEKEEKAGYDIRKHRDTDKGNTVILDTPYCPNTGGISGMARTHAAVALLQPGAPRKMRVDTRRLPGVAYDLNLWECWEMPARYIKINGDRLSADIWGVSQTIQDYYPIGGTLTVHPNYITHDFYCAWGNRTATTPTPPPPPPPIPPLPRFSRRFTTATTTWGKTTTKWKDT